MNEQPLAQRLGDAPSTAIPDHPAVATWRTATAADIDSIHAVTAAADAVDHPSWVTPRDDIADTFDLPHIDHARDTVLAFAADGTAVAFGSAFLHPSRDGKLTVHLPGAVHPEWRRRGIGAEVLRWQDARASEQLAEVAPEVTPTIDADAKVYAEEANTGHQALAQSLGYAPERWFSTMARRSDAAVPVLDGGERITVVAYTPDRDLDALAARNDAFRDHWGSLPTQPENWAKFVGGDFFRPDLSRLALDTEGRIVAFCLTSVNPDDWQTRGRSNAYIDLIGVVRSHRRQGLAPLVVSHALQAIADAGIEEAILDVDTESPTGANTLYTGLGFTAEERSVALVRHF